MASVHFIGYLQGASDFSSLNLCCKYKIIAGDEWKLLEGENTGQTQVDFPADSFYSVWSQPIDIHYEAKTIKGWPKLIMEIYHYDDFGRLELFGYAFTHLPISAGRHSLSVSAWKIVGNLKDKCLSFFLGINPALKNDNILFEGSERSCLKTEKTGVVYLDIRVVLKDFSKNGIHF
jgi:B9 domain-containing protein 2